MGLSLGHIMIVILVFLILFGGKRLPQLMNDLAKGIKAFRNGMHDDGKDQ